MGDSGGENLMGGSIVKMSPGCMCTKDISSTELQLEGQDMARISALNKQQVKQQVCFLI